MEDGRIAKSLLTINEKNELVITKRPVNRHAPINRILEEVGFYSFEFIRINSKRFLIVYEEYEKHTVKTKILVARVHDKIEKVIDISDDDYDSLLQIARDFMKCTIWEDQK